MARPGISYEDVKRTACDLLAQGEKATVQRIRQALGTGSNSTITEHLRRWQRELSETPRPLLPPTVPQAVVTALADFWRVAVEQADAAYQTLCEQAAHTAAVAEQARDEAAHALEQAYQEAALLRDRLSCTEGSCRELEKQLLLEQERRGVAEASIMVVERRSAEVKDAAERLRSEAESRTVKAEEALEQLRVEAERRLAEAEQRLQYERERGEANEERLMKVIDRMRTEHAKVRHGFTEERVAWQGQQRQWQEEIKALREDLTTLQVAAGKAEERDRLLAAELDRARQRCLDLESRHLDAIRGAESLQAKLSAIATDREKLALALANCRKELRRQTPPDSTAPSGNGGATDPD